MPDALPQIETVSLLGVRFHGLSRSQAAAAVAALVREGRRGYLVKPYSEFMPRAARDPKVRDILNNAVLCLADGAGIVWAAHYLSLPGGRMRALLQLPASLVSLVISPSALRSPLPEAMAGVDFTWEMLAALEKAGASVFLLGGRPSEVERSEERIKQRLPGLRVAGRRDGYFRKSGPENEAAVKSINASGADVLLVGMGFPLQEKWIAANLGQLSVKLAVAEGGSFSFIAGTVARAPRWMRRSGLEWLFRLLRQPWRLGRQLAIPVFIWLVLRERLSRASA